MVTTSDIDAIRERAAKAVPGPWRWAGERSTKTISLEARHPKWGVCEVMTFARWGMQNAKPVFTDFDNCILLPDTENRLIYQVCPDATSHDDPRVYRQTISGIRHSDAEFIAHARQDVDDLLAYIDQLKQDLHAQQPLVDYAGNMKVMHGDSDVGVRRAFEEYERRLNGENS